MTTTIRTYCALLVFAGGALTTSAQSLPPLVNTEAPKRANAAGAAAAATSPVKKSPSTTNQASGTHKKVTTLPAPSKLTVDFYNALQSGNTGLAETLLAQGADINCVNCGGEPLLVWAAAGQFNKVAFPNSVQWLLEKGANPNVQSLESGDGALHLVIRTSIDFTKWGSQLDSFYTAVRALLDRGAKPELANKDGVTPLHSAARFVHYGTSPGYTQYGLRLMDDLVKAGGRINLQTRAGNTPLMAGLLADHTQLVTCNEQVVQRLLDLGSDAQLKNKKGQSAYSIVSDLAVAGERRCNPLLGILGGAKTGRSADPSKPAASLAVQVRAPEGLAGEYIGVLRMRTPSAMTVAVTGVISADGSVLLNAPRGITNIGYLSLVDGENFEFRLRTRVPEGYKFANGLHETAEFKVSGQTRDQVFKGQYEAPTDSGEFILCSKDVAPNRSECRPTFAESLNSAIGGLLGTN